MNLCIDVALIDFGDNITKKRVNMNDSEELEENVLLHQKFQIQEENPRKSHGDILEGRKLLKNELQGHSRRKQHIP